MVVYGFEEGVFVSPYNFVDEVRRQMRLPERVIVHDTTLREGEQTPGVVFNMEDKLKICEMLDRVGIQQVEAGFPAASPREKQAVKNLVYQGFDVQIFGFARAVRSDIDAVIDCDTYGLVLSFPPSDIHLKYKLRITREQYLERMVEMVEYAKEHGLYITYSAEDSTRTDLNFLKQVFKLGVEAGVDRARIVDTLGCILPTAMKYLVAEIRNTVDVPIEVHCHNDHGLGVANCLAAVEAGASVLSTSVNGLGERAGLAPTEEVILALRTLYGIRGFRTELLYDLCKLVEHISGVPIPRSKPVTGVNVFAHVSGIHQHAILEKSITYEPYPPEMVGQRRRIILGKLSGSHAVRAKLLEYGYRPSDEEVRLVLSRVKARSEDRRSALTDEEFLEIAKNVLGDPPGQE